MKHLSLTENHLFGKAYRNGKWVSCHNVTVYVLRDRMAEKIKKANPRKEYLNRLGIAVSKKTGGAVVRSRVRRIIRAAFAEIEKSGLKQGYIIVICARKSAVDKKSTDIEKDLRYGFGKLNMIADI